MFIVYHIHTYIHIYLRKIFPWSQWWLVLHLHLLLPQWWSRARGPSLVPPWLASCLEGEMMVQEVGRFWKPRLYARSSRHQLSGRLSRGSLGFSPGAEEGSVLNAVQKAKVALLLSFSSVIWDPGLAAQPGNG